jgi:CRP-like cAMP-binding protein
MVEAFDRIMGEHPLFKDFGREQIKIIQGCASNVRFEAGQFVYREGEEAARFYLLRQGRVSVEAFIVGRGALPIETLSPGDLLGWSWLFPPYKCHFDARALEPVRAIALDGQCLRGKCQADHELGYEFMNRFAGIIARRLQATRMQLLETHGHR